MNIPYVFRKCTKCGKIKLATEKYFSREKNNKWGLRRQCRECRNKRNRERYDNDEEYRNKVKERSNNFSKEKYIKDEEYRKRRLEKGREMRDSDDYRKKAREKWNSDEELRRKQSERYKNKRINDSEWREKENKKRRERYKNNSKNEEWVKEEKRKRREYLKNNPNISFNQNNRRRNKLKNQGRGIIDEQYKECNEWFNWECAYSNEKLQNNNSTYGRTLDHIVALDNGGLNEPWNVIPMRRGYNCSKNSTKNSLTWYMEQEYFNEERLNKIVEWQIYAYNKWGGEEFGELILIIDLI